MLEQTMHPNSSEADKKKKNLTDSKKKGKHFWLKGA